jgi:hypothetical protein
MDSDNKTLANENATEVGDHMKPSSEFYHYVNQDSVAAYSAKKALTVELVVDHDIINKCLSILETERRQIQQLVQIAKEDPILTIEIFKEANSLLAKDNRPQVSTLNAAIIALGSVHLSNCLRQLATRKPPTEFVLEALNEQRQFSLRVSKVAKLVARFASPAVEDDAEVSGLASGVGLMLSCSYLMDRYVSVANESNRATTIYRLAHDYNLDENRMLLAYLRLYKFPEELIIPFDLSITCRNPLQSSLRLTIQAAIEIVDAFDNNKWTKYSPENDLPVKSTLRLLPINPNQYSKLYLEISKTLNYQDINQTTSESEISSKSGNTYRRTLSIHFLEPSNDNQHSEIKSTNSDLVSSLKNVIQAAENAEDLGEKLLNHLTKNGMFKRAALLVIEGNGKSASVFRSTGQNMEAESKININDFLAPLALGATKIQSFNSKLPDPQAPFGHSSFAMSPIKVKYDSPVMLYADCENERPLGFEMRKLFRQVVEIANKTLSSLPGGIH